jgi:hypothetical protein
MRNRVVGSVGALILVLVAGCSGSMGSSAADDGGNAQLPPSGAPSPTVSPGTAAGPTAAPPVTAVPGASPATPGPSASDGEGSGAFVPSDPSTGPDPSAPGNGQGQPGVLTAGTWDDSRNFDFFASYRKSRQSLGGRLPFAEQAFLDALSVAREQPPAKETLDVAFVIDTTGSMGDEISYLQAEFVALSNSISARYPDAAQRWSLVVYRDENDEYVVRSHDFVDDVTAFQKELGKQVASGGGDFPEAPDQALAQAAELHWRADEATARLAFWVADAPHHAEKAEAMADAVDALLESGVHVYPVASSGVDDLTELSMRSVAQLTGGRYLFLTDDSGVGNSHKEPTLPCYFVTKLNDAIRRMVDIELTGEYREPSEDEVIRTGGNPENRRCTLESGEVVEAY